MKGLSGKLLLSLIKAVLIATCLLFSQTIFSQKESGADIQTITVTEMSIKELQRNYPSDLPGVIFDQNQDGLDLLLKNVGNNVEVFFRNLANISAKEEVALHRIAPNGSRDWYKDFYYLILPKKIGFAWTEERTGTEEGKDEAIRPIDKTPQGFCMIKGYAYACIYVHPDHQKSSLFRCIGRAGKKPGAYVIAFTQKPQAKDYLTEYINPEFNISIQFLVQGFIWLDPDNYQILRMKTHMLAPDAALKKQSTDIFYQKVRFDGIQQSFWLPKEVNITWTLPNVTYRNRHKYSDFRLFSVETDYKINQPQKRK